MSLSLEAFDWGEIRSIRLTRSSSLITNRMDFSLKFTLSKDVPCVEAFVGFGERKGYPVHVNLVFFYLEIDDIEGAFFLEQREEFTFLFGGNHLVSR